MSTAAPVCSVCERKVGGLWGTARPVYRIAGQQGLRQWRDRGAKLAVNLWFSGPLGRKGSVRAIGGMLSTFAWAPTEIPAAFTTTRARASDRNGRGWAPIALKAWRRS